MIHFITTILNTLTGKQEITLHWFNLDFIIYNQGIATIITIILAFGIMTLFIKIISLLPKMLNKYIERRIK